MSNEKLNKLSMKELNELYRNKKVVYDNYFGEIIHIWYGSNLGDIPYAEIQSLLDSKKIRSMPLSKVVLVASVA